MNIKTAIIALFFWTSLSAHPYHHSLAILDENTTTAELELSFKMLSEDYAVITEKQDMTQYFNRHFVLTTDGTETLSATYQGSENDGNFTWLYFSYDLSDDWQRVTQLSIHNKLMLALNEKQINTVKLQVFGQQWSYNFNANNRKHRFVKPKVSTAD